jgi:hypothetical protein
VAEAIVLVGPETSIERKGPNGGPNQVETGPITLAEVQPGVDRIWWRGEVVGPATVAGDRVRVREE